MIRDVDAEPSSALARDLAILFLAGVLSLGALWLAGGPRLAPDSYRYLRAAQRINLDLPLVGQQRLAPGYTHSLAWLQRRGLDLMPGIQVTALAQCLISLAAAGLAYMALAPLWGRRAALLGGSSTCSCPISSAGTSISLPTARPTACW